MARLHEYEGKRLLRAAGLRVPRGEAAANAADAERIAGELLSGKKEAGIEHGNAGATGQGARGVVVKIQAWTTGRAALGGVKFADTAKQAGAHAEDLLKMQVGNFPVTHVLVEEKLDIAAELFVSLTIDDAARSPVMLVAAQGGSGIEGRGGEVRRIACGVKSGPDAKKLRDVLGASRIDARYHAELANAIETVFRAARANEARSLEVNPLVVTKGGDVVAADCRVTIDDYAVFRHPELGIEIARELDHPPTELEKIAYRVEQADHRGTFFFAQMNTGATAGSKGLIGFHGAGGGGSMMSMDAITNEGFTIANFCDTSGNPSPAKVYRAARIILSQPGLVGYFGSGSGVANQEQYWSAYGLAKAFLDVGLDIPAVIRLGGNTEDRAVEILESACTGLGATVEGYKKADTPGKIAARFAALVAEAGGKAWQPRGGGRVGGSGGVRVPGFVGGADAVSFAVKGGRVWIDGAAWKRNAGAIVARSGGLLRDEAGSPAITVKAEEFLAKDSEMIACEVECRRDGIEGVFVELEVPGLA